MLFNSHHRHIKTKPVCHFFNLCYARKAGQQNESPTSRSQVGPEVFKEPFYSFSSALAPVKGEVHPSRSLLFFRGWKVRRIENDQIELGLDAPEEISTNYRDAVFFHHTNGEWIYISCQNISNSGNEIP